MAKTATADEARRTELLVRIEAEGRRASPEDLARQLATVDREILAVEAARKVAETPEEDADLKARWETLTARQSYLADELTRSQARLKRLTDEVNSIDRRAFVAERRQRRAEFDEVMGETLAEIRKVLKRQLPLLRVCAIEDHQARAKAAHLVDSEHPAPPGGLPFDTFFTTPVNFMRLLLNPALDDPGILRALRNGDRP